MLSNNTGKFNHLSHGEVRTDKSMIKFIYFRRYLFFVVPILISACGQPANTSTPVTTTKPLPNIVLIVADDLGINDVGYNGNSAVRTPNLDSLAMQGTVFTSAYASSPVCSPSRAGLLTGQHQQRFGMESNPSPRQLAIRTVADDSGAKIIPKRMGDPEHAARGLPPEAITIAERLQANGYQTAHIGKWHLGSAPGYRPQDQGFDDFFGFLGGASMFAERNDTSVVGAQLKWNGLDNFLWDRLPYSLEHNGTPQAERGYQTDVFADRAVEFILEAGEPPFFLQVAFNAPHNPLQAPRVLVEAQPTNLPDHQRVYYAMIEALDSAIGKIIDALAEADIEGETIVIITSDNGGASYIHIDDVNAPFRGFKANFWEGGIRVPLIIYQPNQSDRPRTIESPTSLLDLTPLILDAVGLPADNLDGLSPYAIPTGRTLVWRNNSLWAIRSGDWKLIKDDHRDRVWLYNLADDPNETTNLSYGNSSKSASMEAQFLAEVADWPSSPAWAPTYIIPVYADPVENPMEADNDDWTYWPG